MSGGPDILLIADRPLSGADAWAGQLTGDGGRLVQRTDPYEALEDMARQSWSLILVTAPRADLAGLCRASRRLQPKAKLVALCAPAAEPESRQLVGSVLDDYLIYPPTRSDLAHLRGLAAPQEGTYVSHRPVREEAPPEPGQAFSPRELARLLEAARSVASLESYVAAMVKERLGIEAQWQDAEKAGSEARPLLAIGGDLARTLVPAGAAEIDASAEALLAGLRQFLPVLADSARRTEALHRLAITDHLTGAYNRRYFYHFSDQILLRARQKPCRVSLLLYDIDNFKRYNDTYGHAAGDEILRETAALMKRIVRSQDVVARIGGDEFAVLFWDSEPPRSPRSRPLESALALADRFRQAVRNHQFPSLGPEARGALTISGGLANFPEGGQNVRELLRSADRALRDVKRLGKDAIHLVGSEGPAL